MPLELTQFAAIAAGAVLGPIFGSFVTALSYRLPRGESIAAGRSRCPRCGTPLGVRDLVPMLSWLANRGKCRHCGAAISARYPVIELISLTLFVASAALLRDPVAIGLVFCFIPIALALAIVDFEHQRLPNVLIALLLPVALAWRWHEGQGVVAGLIAAVAAVAALLVLDQILKRRTGESGIGGGDVKLIALAALCLPLLPFLVMLAIAGATGLLLGVWWRRRTGQQKFPFGVNVLMAWWLCMVVPIPTSA